MRAYLTFAIKFQLQSSVSVLCESRVKMRGEQVDTKEPARNIVAFFLFGVLIKMPTSIIKAAAADILAGSSLATSSLTVLSGVASVIFALVLPWLLQKLLYSSKIAIITCLHAAGFVIIVTADSLVLRLVGVCVLELGRANAGITLFAMTAFYSNASIHAIVAGTGVGAVLGTLYYTGVSSWTCVSPRITVAIATPSVLLFVIVYAILDKSPLDQNSQNISFAGVKYNALHDEPNKQPWYRVFSNVEMILALCFVMGVCTGCIYTYTPLIVADKFQDCAEREFAQGILSLGDTAADDVAEKLESSTKKLDELFEKISNELASDDECKSMEIPAPRNVSFQITVLTSRATQNSARDSQL
ncbi:battenin CLN3 protein [Desmophyllum pertusum]|uniref:Battenin n=1 Tax=Desmophyllum pertusum TaxID=174260 RepID=A0A9X0D8L3_9CNID|nr:battenin CLN3 protein [Desmophyllum pertusum]